MNDKTTMLSQEKGQNTAGLDVILFQREGAVHHTTAAAMLTAGNGRGTETQTNTKDK